MTWKLIHLKDCYNRQDFTSQQLKNFRNEITDEDLEKYDKHLHNDIFPGENPDNIKELSGDGIEKIIVKVGQDDAPKKMAGRPPQRKEKMKL